jgi:hypothetical protein
MHEGVPVTLRSIWVCSAVILQREFTIAACWHGLTRLVRAPHEMHRQFAWHGIDSPISRDPRLPDHAHHRLATGMDVERLHGNLLLALAAVAVEGFDQRDDGPGSLFAWVRASLRPSKL